MNKWGHKAFGAGLSAIPAIALVEPVGLPAAAAFWVSALPASTAPDWLEIRVGDRTLIPHRTVTHWVLPWAALLAAGVFWLAQAPGIAPAVMAGFAVGGLTHLLGDSLTPMGVPLWTPFRRVALMRVPSGRLDLLLVIVAWMVAVAFAVGMRGALA